MPEVPSCLDFVCLIQHNNAIANGLFGNMILVAVFGIVFLTLMYRDVKQAFVAASFTTSIISFPLATINVITPSYVVVLSALTAISVTLLFVRERNP